MTRKATARSAQRLKCCRRVLPRDGEVIGRGHGLAVGHCCSASMILASGNFAQASSVLTSMLPSVTLLQRLSLWSAANIVSPISTLPWWLAELYCLQVTVAGSTSPAASAGDEHCTEE